MLAVSARELSQPKIKLLGLLLPALGIGLLLPRLLRFGQISAGFLAWPWQFDFSEGVNLDAATLLAQGTNIYRHNGPDAFVSAPYTPLFYVLNVPFAWLFGPTFGPGRIMSLIATIAIAVLLAWCVRKVAASWAFGALAGVIWLSASPVIVWSALYTQSMLAPAFEIAGLAWVLAWPEGRRSYVSIIFFALAFFTKQTAVDAPVAVALWLLVRDVRHGLRFVAWMAAAVLVPFGVANLATKGGLWEHTIGNQILAWRLDRFWKTMDKFWASIGRSS